MTSPVTRGARELRRLLREQTCDVRALDLAGFRRWLDGHLAHWQRDAVFVQRTRIRDLRRAHPRLRALEAEQRQAADAEAATPESSRHRRLEQELIDADKAVAGLTAALATAAAERLLQLREKLAAFELRRCALRDEQARLLQASPQRQALLRAGDELRQCRAEIGLDQEEARLDELLRQQGRRSGRAGDSFEDVALALTHEQIVPDLRRRGTPPDMRVLKGVTLGAARVEFDQLVIRRPGRPAEPVEALAVVEAKRNINDLAHGFRLRQENLAWLTGDAARYDAQLYRTAHFRSGHFDRAAAHHEGGEDFLFAPGSFRRFRRDPSTGLLLNRLYFVTRPGMLWGLSAAALARVAFRVATDERWDPDGDAYLGGLLDWCRSLAEPTEAPDVLSLYAATPRRGRQILLVASA